MKQIFDFISQLRYTKIKCQSMLFAKLDLDSGMQWYLATLVKGKGKHRMSIVVFSV